MSESHFKQMIDMLTYAKIRYAQIDHGNGRSTLILARNNFDDHPIHIDFERGKMTDVKVVV